MQSVVAIHALGGKLRPKEVVCITTVTKILAYFRITWQDYGSTSSHRLGCSVRSSAVTRLAVYRQLKVPTQDARTRRRPEHMCGHINICVVIALDLSI